MTRKRPPSTPSAPPPVEATCTIAALAHKGEGRAEIDGVTVHVPFTLPGETVRVEHAGGRGRLLEVLTSAPDRVAPACRHFGTCGGCALQHMEQSAVLGWKRDQVVAALAARGLEAADTVRATVDAHGAGRRRAVFAATRAGNKTLFGFHERASHRLVDLAECPVLVPEIVAALPDLRRLASAVLPRKGEVAVTVLASGTGLDVDLKTPARLAHKEVPALVEQAMAAGLARLSVNGEPLVEARAPTLDMGGVAVVPPPAGFVQATAAGEAALAGLVAEAVGDARKVADLFAGVGTFALRLARQASVHAVESERAALDALDAAMRRGGGALREIRAERRDLFRNPLTAGDLDDFGAGVEAVVFDPPRAGAEAQAREIARSRVPRIAAVSCNPATLARDLRHLVDGGYRIETVTPVDQFRHAPHIEVVAGLVRA
ncbi:RNA methyltransferase [Stappia sp.]|uniref:class I SAM-dependent RNA methyltransferase n=1 Tax=Stappia sp. TaxID=1870903 RepID=UPI0032D99D75